MTGEPGNIRVLVAGGPGKHTLLVPVVGHDPQRDPARGGMTRSSR